MKALTIRQPWAAAIAAGVKTVENRTWRPSIDVGERFAIHAGKTLDREGLQSLKEAAPELWPDMPLTKHMNFGGIIATVTFAGAVHIDKVELDDPWAVGPNVWRLEDVETLDHPVPCSGQLGLWQVPRDLLEQVLEDAPPAVHLHYAKRYQSVVRTELQHAEGTLLLTGHGEGPRNCLVELDTGERVVVPRGNVRWGAAPPPPAQLELFSQEYFSGQRPLPAIPIED